MLNTQETMRGGVDVKGVHFTWATGGVMVGGATPERWRVGGAWEVLDHYVPRTPTPLPITSEHGLIFGEGYRCSVSGTKTLHVYKETIFLGPICCMT